MNSQNLTGFNNVSMSDEEEAARYAMVHGYGDVNIPMGEELDDPIERSASERLFGPTS
jgi:hypothetical protein